MRRKNWRDVRAPILTPEQVAVKLYDSAKNKATMRGLEFAISFRDVLSRVHKGKCEVTGIPFDMRQKPRCGTDFPFRASLDRVDNTKGYVQGNIMVVCKIYNQAKWSWNADDVQRMAHALINGDNP